MGGGGGGGAGSLATMDEKWLPVIHRKSKYDGTVPSIEPLRLEKCFTSSWFEQRNKIDVQGSLTP